jgi:hypothetical protein
MRLSLDLLKEINWMDLGPMTLLLENYGYAVGSDMSEDDVRAALKESIADGSIPEHEVSDL